MGRRESTSATKSPWWCGILPGIVLVLIIGLIWLLWRHDIFPKDVPNVILISIDTCRADYLGSYGHPGKISPNIDAVAQEAVLFNHMLTPVPLTLPAHASMLTGTIPPYHGVHYNIGYRLEESNLTVAEPKVPLLILGLIGFVFLASAKSFIFIIPC